MLKSYLCIFLMIFFSVPLSCREKSNYSAADDRAALFDYILTKTLERESFSPIKNEILNLDIKAGILRYKDEMIAADTDEKLFNVLMKISNARKDRHLSVNIVDGGLKLPSTEISHAPIRFAVDYGTSEDFFFFVSDYAKNINDFTGDILPEIGDRLTMVNGQSIEEYFKDVEPYHRYSTINGLWWKFAESLPEKSYRIPPTLKRNMFVITLERKDAAQYTISLPYLDSETIEWHGFYKEFGVDRYPDFSAVYTCQTYVLYKNDDGKKVLLLDWYGFRENLVADMDRLVEYAAEHKMLDYAIIWDGTRSRGGSKGAYALQRLSPEPFKTTFGNLRISDITEPFIQDRRARFNKRKMTDKGVTETVDDGSWLMDWLENDVAQAVNDGRSYSDNVPFKLAHLPKHSDGILQPADVHFTGKLVCFFGPYGGSHLDQFAAQVIDNNLGWTIGMSAGGYSNTWEWNETLVFTISKKPVVEFMWSIGHTIRPNGEILEGNPARMDEYIPVTRNNYLTYTESLLESAFKHLGFN